MSDHPTIIERAFQLARSGEFQTLVMIKRQLEREGHSIAHVNSHLNGAGLRRTIAAICAQAQRDRRAG